MDVNGVKIIEGRAGIRLLPCYFAVLICCAILLSYFGMLFDIRLKAQPETKNHQDQPGTKTLQTSHESRLTV